MHAFLGIWRMQYLVWLGDIHPDLFTPNFDWKAVEHFFAGQQVLTVAQIILPTMPGAGDALAIQETLANRSTLMRTDAVNGPNFTCIQKSGNNSPIN
jgi:hypothetical protein